MRRRDEAQNNVTASTLRTQAAIASGRARIDDPNLTDHARAVLTAIVASHENHLLECRDAQEALDDGELPEGWAR